jgi:hypothetical protein
VRCKSTDRPPSLPSSTFRRAHLRLGLSMNRRDSSRRALADEANRRSRTRDAGHPPNLALRVDREMVVGVQRRLSPARGPLLSALHRTRRPTGARRRVRDGPPAPSISPRGARRRRLRRLGGHDRALPREGCARGAVSNSLRAGDARARPAPPLQDDLRVRCLRAREHSRARLRGATALPRIPSARWNAASRHRGSLRRFEAVAGTG